MKGLVTALHKSGDYEGKKWYQISVMETGKQYAMKGITNDDPMPYLGQKDELDMVCNETPTNKPNPYKPGTILINRNFILPNNPNIQQARDQAHSTPPQTGNVSSEAGKGALTYSKDELNQTFAKFRKELNDMQSMLMDHVSKFKDIDHEIQDLKKSHAGTTNAESPTDSEEAPDPEPEEEDINANTNPEIPF